MHFRFQVFKERVNAFKVIITVPEKLSFLFRELVIRTMNREIEFNSVFQQWFGPFAHDFCSPGSDCAFVNRKRLIWNDQFLIDAENLTETFARTARTERRSEERRVGKEW